MGSEHRGLVLLSELLDIPSPSGHEARMADFLLERLRSFGYSPELDGAGNVLVRVAGRESDRPTYCLAAHTDELGMTTTAIEGDGKLRVDRLGGLHPWKIGETPVEILGDRGSVRGVVSMGSGHSRIESGSPPDWDRVRILTGLSPERLGAAGVRPGSPVVPIRAVRGPFSFGDEAEPWVAAWTFDNRLGMVALLLALEDLRHTETRPRSPLLAAFTVEEEIGCLGAKVLAQRERPDVFIAIDGSPLVPECPVELDGRPAIRSRDRAATYDQELLTEICEISEAAGVRLQPVVYSGAASDASLVYSAGACERVACLGYVRASSHGLEATPLSTFDHLTTVVSALIDLL